MFYKSHKNYVCKSKLQLLELAADLHAAFVDVDVMTGRATPRLAEQHQILKQEDVAHGLLAALPHQKLILPQ